MVKMKTEAVITGDIINSSILSDEQKTLVRLNLEQYTLNNPDILLPLQFYRGDSFQLMVKKEKAARIAVFIEAIIYSSVNTFARISIGIGLVSKIVPDNVLQSEGEAFQLSGHQMDTMKEEGRLMKISLNNKQYQSILSATFYLAESIILGWKPRMAAVIAQIPFAKTQKEIAEEMNISSAAVSKALKAGNWPSVENFLNGYEKALKEI